MIFVLQNATMTILGIDPGSLRCGWGCIARKNNRLVLLGAGVIRGQGEHLAERLACITRALDDILTQYQPMVASFETAFHGKNAQSALVLGHARGAAMATVARSGCRVFEYTAGQIKSIAAGHGRASKEQVQSMICAILGIPEGLPLDASDAVAAAICHAETHDTPTAALLRKLTSENR